MHNQPFDIQCYNQLFEKFQYIFETELINEICKNGQLQTFEANTLLIDLGDTITMMPLVISGSIKIMTEDKKGSELLLYYLELGDTCAVTLNCCTRKAKSTIKAITETRTEILFVPIEMMETWMVKFQSWRAYVLQSYNSRLNEMLQAIDILAFHNMEERLYIYLKDKAAVLHNPKLEITHAEIAIDLNTSRVVISRLMKKLSLDNKIKMLRNSVEVVF